MGMTAHVCSQDFLCSTLNPYISLKLHSMSLQIVDTPLKVLSRVVIPVHHGGSTSKTQIVFIFLKCWVKSQSTWSNCSTTVKIHPMTKSSSFILMQHIYFKQYATYTILVPCLREDGERMAAYRCWGNAIEVLPCRALPWMYFLPTQSQLGTSKWAVFLTQDISWRMLHCRELPLYSSRRHRMKIKLWKLSLQGWNVFANDKNVVVTRRWKFLVSNQYL